MPLTHPAVLARTRSYLAALADQAEALDASAAYEDVLTSLDRMHGDDCPAIDARDLPTSRVVLLGVATASIERLERHGLDPLNVELLIAMLNDAYAKDVG